MPALKQSTDCTRRYGGIRGDQELKYAITLLFQIKGTEYQTEKDASFIVPTADEFLGTVKRVNRALSKKKAGEARRASPPRHRSLLRLKRTADEAAAETKLLTFLQWILHATAAPATLFDLFTVCASIVQYALFNYLFLIEFMKNQITSTKDAFVAAKAAIAGPEFQTSFSHSLHCFLANYVPCCLPMREALSTTTLRFLENQAAIALQAPLTPVHSVEDISAIVVRAFDSLYSDAPLIQKALASPMARSLSRVGFEVC